MIKIRIIVLLIVVASCNSKVKDAQLLEELKLNKHGIGFLNKNIVLPDEFKKINLKELEEMLRQNPELNAVDKLTYKLATHYQNNGIAPVLFRDETEQPISIWFIPATYIKLNKEMVATYTDMVRSTYVVPMKSQGIHLEIMKSSFVKINGIEAIKLVCKFETNNKIAYQTQYIATRGLDTFSLMVISEFEIATNFILKAIQP